MTSSTSESLSRSAQPPPSGELADLYRTMLMIRRCEEQILAAHDRSLITGSTHLCIGQEAIPAGASASLHPGDPVVATYRGHGWVLSRGAGLVDFFAEVLGRSGGLNGGRAGSAYLSDLAHGFFGENSIVGAGVPIALGLGLACQRRGDGSLPLVAIGDGAMNQGNVHESLNMASVLRVPLLVVVENNGYAEMTPSAMLTAVPAARRAAAYGIDGLEVDGNDPIQVRDVLAEARARSLADGRPVLVEAHTHRLTGHYSGDAQAYRPAGELAEKRLEDPLPRAAAHLDPELVARLTGEVEATVRGAFEQALALPLPLPDPQEARTHVFAS